MSFQVFAPQDRETGEVGPAEVLMRVEPDLRPRLAIEHRSVERVPANAADRREDPRLLRRPVPALGIGAERARPEPLQNTHDTDYR
jgi:hypothetical protein